MKRQGSLTLIQRRLGLLVDQFNDSNEWDPNDTSSNSKRRHYKEPSDLESMTHFNNKRKQQFDNFFTDAIRYMHETTKINKEVSYSLI